MTKQQDQGRPAAELQLCLQTAIDNFCDAADDLRRWLQEAASADPLNDERDLNRENAQAFRDLTRAFLGLVAGRLAPDEPRNVIEWEDRGDGQHVGRIHGQLSYLLLYRPETRTVELYETMPRLNLIFDFQPTASLADCKRTANRIAWHTSRPDRFQA